MEQSAKTTRITLTLESSQTRTGEQPRKPQPSANDIRRQLGWGLIDISRKGAYR